MKLLTRLSAIPIGLALILLLGLIFPVSSFATSVEEGELEGALFKILQPAEWNGKMLVIAHGYIPPEAPLVVDLNPEAPFMRQLVGCGWLIAKTSYRRNGLVIADGLEDLDNLVRYVAAKYGQPQMVILEGSSMGGSMAVKAAERVLYQPEKNQFDGVVALGAAMDIRVGKLELVWTLHPGLPVLFLSNRNEITGPADYTAGASYQGIRPVLWRLERDGHVNLNFAERMAALVAMEGWLTNETRPPGTAPRGWDATIELGTAQSTARNRGGKLVGQVVRIDEAYGNIGTSFVLSDLQYLGLELGDTLVISVGGNQISAIWGSKFSDVAADEFVVFVSATGYVRLGVNMGNAAARLQIEVGAELTLAADIP